MNTAIAPFLGVVALLGLAACAPASPDSAAPGNETNPTTTAAAEAPEPGDLTITITIDGTA